MFFKKKSNKSKAEKNEKRKLPDTCISALKAVETERLERSALAKFNDWQLDEINKGKESNINYAVYMDADLTPTQMKYAREALEKGASPYIIKSRIEKYKNDEDKYKEEMENSIYIVDGEYLIGQYKPDLSKQDESQNEGNKEDVLYGLVYGDICGSTLEGKPLNERKIDENIHMNGRYTDDTVLSCFTLTICEELGRGDERFAYDTVVEAYECAGSNFNDAGYGSGFYRWLQSEDKKPYRSYGNGSAMRSPVIGAYFEKAWEVIKATAISAEVTHNHPEGVKGAIIVAVSVWMLLHGYSKDDVFDYMRKYYSGKNRMFNEFTMEEVIKSKQDLSCMHTVPASVIIFYYSESFEDAIEKSLLYALDADTVGAIVGALAGAYYRTSDRVRELVESKKPWIFDEALRELTVNNPSYKNVRES